MYTVNAAPREHVRKEVCKNAENATTKEYAKNEVCNIIIHAALRRRCEEGGLTTQ